jgi:hypothetical protein
MLKNTPIFLWKEPKEAMWNNYTTNFSNFNDLFLIKQMSKPNLYIDSSISLSKMGWHYDFMTLHVFISKDPNTNFNVSFLCKGICLNLGILTIIPGTLPSWKDVWNTSALKGGKSYVALYK